MRVVVDGELLEAMLSLARERHPYEIVLLLRGTTSADEVIIEELLLPPFATSGKGFAEFPSHMLPIDFSIVGTVHSHPSGPARPSTIDLNRFYSRVMLILAHPYSERDVAAFNARGEELHLRVEGR